MISFFYLWSFTWKDYFPVSVIATYTTAHLACAAIEIREQDFLAFHFTQDGGHRHFFDVSVRRIYLMLLMVCTFAPDLAMVLKSGQEVQTRAYDASITMLTMSCVSLFASFTRFIAAAAAAEATEISIGTKPAVASHRM